MHNGDKTELELVFVESYDKVYNYGRAHGYRSHWTNFDQVTVHFLFTCEKYPNAKFDVVFYKGKNPELKAGEKIKVYAKVRQIDVREYTVYMNYAKVVGDKVEADETSSEAEESNISVL